jgi:hypothetical protein
VQAGDDTLGCKPLVGAGFVAGTAPGRGGLAIRYASYLALRFFGGQRQAHDA